MLKGEGLFKRFGSLEVLRDVNVKINEGEIVSIVGASGAGKSTLLHILGTLDEPDAGQVLFNDKKIEVNDSKSINKIRNEEMGFVFQFHNLMAELTALENISLPGLISGKSLKETNERALELLEMLSLSNRAEHLPSQLSGGEMQRVAVGRALFNKPKIVFADEPSGNLDSKNASELHQLFFNLRNKLGFAMVIVTHNNDLARESDRILTLKDGQLIT